PPHATSPGTAARATHIHPIAIFISKPSCPDPRLHRNHLFPPCACWGDVCPLRHTGDHTHGRSRVGPPARRILGRLKPCRSSAAREEDRLAWRRMRSGVHHAFLRIGLFLLILVGAAEAYAVPPSATTTPA